MKAFSPRRVFNSPVWPLATASPSRWAEVAERLLVVATSTPTGRKLPPVGPDRVEAGQKSIMYGDDLGRFEKAGLVVGLGWQLALRSLCAQASKQAAERGRSAAMHPEHEQAFPALWLMRGEWNI